MFSVEIYNYCKSHILHLKNVEGVIIDYCVKYSNIKFDNFFENNGSEDCKNHKIEVLSYVIRILLRRNCSWLRFNIKKSTRQLLHLKKHLN